MSNENEKDSLILPKGDLKSLMKQGLKELEEYKKEQMKNAGYGFILTPTTNDLENIFSQISNLNNEIVELKKLLKEQSEYAEHLYKILQQKGLL